MDVASFQHPNGVAIDWPQVAADGIQFAAVKATEGDYYKNPYALTDLAEAKAAGLSVLAYAFAIPDGDDASESPVVQADDLLSYLGTDARTVPVMLDIEYNPNPDRTGQCYGLSRPAMVTWISGFDNEVRVRTGRLPAIYAPPQWWQACTGGSGAFRQTPLWDPEYTTGSGPALAAGWTNWAFWQYTSTGTVPGISGNADLDQLNPRVVPLLDPGAERYRVGSPVDQRLESADPVAGQSLTFSATGLPRGLSISAGGKTTGWPVVPGTANVTVTASDGGGGAASVSFPWTVSIPADSGPAGPVRLDLHGKCLNDVGNRSASGTPADIWTCDGRRSERWSYVQDGTLRIHRKCLTVPAAPKNGWRARLEPCTDAARQQWRLAYPRALSSSLGRSPTTLVSRGSGKCLDDPGWSTANGTRVAIWSCDGHRNQAWTLPAGPLASGIPGECLDDNGNGTANGTRIGIRACRASAAQAWTVKPDGTVRVNGRCLTMTANGTASGTPAELYSCDGRGGQQWRMVPDGGEAMLENPRSGLCLADPADATVGGTRLEALACASADPGSVWRAS